MRFIGWRMFRGGSGWFGVAAMIVYAGLHWYFSDGERPGIPRKPSVYSSTWNIRTIQASIIPMSHPHSLRNPIHLYGTHPSRITLVCEDKFIIHDRLHFLPKQHTTRMNRHILIPANSFVTTIRE